MILAKRIAYEKRIKNVQLSKATGIGEASVSKILNGRLRPYPVQMKKIALVLKYEGNPEELFKEALDE